MSALPPRGARYGVYARYSTNLQGTSSNWAPSRDRVAFDPARAANVPHVRADYGAGTSSLAIAQALTDAKRRDAP